MEGFEEFTFHLSISSVSHGLSLLYTDGIVKVDAEGCLVKLQDQYMAIEKKSSWAEYF